MAKIALINPRFEVSYWGMEYVMPIASKRANMPVSVLPLLAALTPEQHSVVLIDENVEQIDYSQLDEVDIVGITGMSVQRFRMKEILTELKRRGKFVVLGGAWVTVQEDYFGDLPDAIFVGEADETWPQFLRDWTNGAHEKRYEQATKTDMAALPTPRFDLLKIDRYLFGSIQISRGCPFLCEFCDIIVTFGRRPRVKNSTQVISELEALRQLKIKQIFIVDDNFVGNKHLIKDIVKEIIIYQEKHGYPFRFFTEASLDLAEDEELLALMTEANINAVFIGLESPNEESLKETRKTQNIRPKSGSMLDRVRKIQHAGIEVWCGMIAGFDHDDESVFDAHFKFLAEAHIPHVMIGMLYAIPKTPLHDRLRNEDRLDTADILEFGTNVIPLKMSREALLNGYMNTMRKLHDTEHYFDRLEYLYLQGNLHHKNLGRARYWNRHPVQKIKQQTLNSIGAILFFTRLMKHVTIKELKKEYRSRIWRAVKATRDPSIIFTYIGKCAMHFHYDRLIHDLEDGKAINTL